MALFRNERQPRHSSLPLGPHTPSSVPKKLVAAAAVDRACSGLWRCIATMPAYQNLALPEFLFSKMNNSEDLHEFIICRLLAVS
jgi:hypothetical protein